MNPREQRFAYLGQQLGYLMPQESQVLEARGLTMETYLRQQRPGEFAHCRFLFLKFCLLQLAIQHGQLRRDQGNQLLQALVNALKQGQGTPALTFVGIGQGKISMEFARKAAADLLSQGIWTKEEHEICSRLLAACVSQPKPAVEQAVPNNSGATTLLTREYTPRLATDQDATVQADTTAKWLNSQEVTVVTTAQSDTTQGYGEVAADPDTTAKLFDSQEATIATTGQLDTTQGYDEVAADSDTTAKLFNSQEATVVTTGQLDTVQGYKDSSMSATSDFIPPVDTSSEKRPKLGVYEIVKELGAGGMGKVYQAYHPQLSRTVAIKVMLHGGQISAKDRARFIAEANLTAQLRHPNIVVVYDTASEGETDYMVMEFLDGEPLSSTMKKTRLSPRRTLEIMKDVALAVDYAHQQNIVHRDLKPANIMIEKNTNRPVVMDFGLAKNIKVGKELSKTGDILGTPRYMAPEQARGDVRAITAATDIYALGAILYEMLTGAPVVDGATAFNMIYNIINKDIIPPRQKNPNLSVDLESICLKALEKEPARRYASAKEMAEDFDRFLRGEITLARPVGVWQQSWKKIVRHKLAVGLILLFCLITGSLGWWGYNVVRQQELEAQFQAPWTQWWNDCHSQLKEDDTNLQATAEILERVKNILYEQGSPIIEQWQHQPDKFLITNRCFTAWQGYDSSLFDEWQKYQRQLQKIAGLIPKYQGLQDRYQNLQKSFPAYQNRLATMLLHKIKLLPKEIHARFFVSPNRQRKSGYTRMVELFNNDRRSPVPDNLEQLDGIKQVIVLLGHERQSAIVAAEKSIAQREEAIKPQHLEWAKWLLAYAQSLDVTEAAGESVNIEHLQKQRLTILQTRYDEITTRRLQVSGSQANQSIIKAMDELRQLCLMDCTFVRAYYQLGRMLQQFEKADEAEVYYEKALQREENYLTLYYLNEIYFDRWRHLIQQAALFEDSQQSRDVRQRMHLCREQITKIGDKISVHQQGNHDLSYQTYQEMYRFYTKIIETETHVFSDYDENTTNNLLTFYLSPPKTNAETVKGADPKDKRTRDYGKAINTYRELSQILEGIPADGFLGTQKLFLQGLIYSDLAMLREQSDKVGSYAELALQCFRNAVAADSSYPRAREALAETYYALKDFKAAQEQYDTLFSILVPGGDPKNTSPWKFKNYIKYLLCLVQQQKNTLAIAELENSVRLWENWAKEHTPVNTDSENRQKNYPDDISKLATAYMILDLLYLQENQLDKLEKLVEKIYWENLGFIRPHLEGFFYILSQLRLAIGNNDPAGRKAKASKVFQLMYREHTSVREVIDIYKTKPFLKNMQPFLEYYEDPFLADPRYRKIPEVVLDHMHRYMSDQFSSYLKLIMEITNDPLFAKQLVRFVQKDAIFAREFRQFFKDEVGYEVPLEMLFSIYGKGAVDSYEKYLLSMETLPSPEARYYKAVACYRRSLYEKNPEQQQNLYLTSLRLLQEAISENPGETKYHYAAAIIASLLAAKEIQYLPDGLMHLELAWQLDWHDSNYPKNDPALATLRNDKRVQQLLAAKPKPLRFHSWEEICQRIQGLFDIERKDLAWQLYITYNASMQHPLGKDLTSDNLVERFKLWRQQK